MEYISYYMNAMKKYQPLKMKEVDEVIQKVNQNVAIATIKSQDSKQIHHHFNIIDKKKQNYEIIIKLYC
uniref:Uncharacterized protein n=1 Tax=Onchocerca volvulus TaxID=6282 RepID=A0A8R1TPK8_ONCVO